MRGDEASGALLRAQVYDTHADYANADAFAIFVEELPVGRLIAVAVMDEAASKLTERAKRACEMLGGGLVRNLADRGSRALMGVNGSALEQLDNDGATSVLIWAPFPQAEPTQAVQPLGADLGSLPLSQRLHVLFVLAQ